MKVGDFVTPVIADDLLLSYRTYTVEHIDIYKRITVKGINAIECVNKKYVQSRFIVIDPVEMAMILAT